MRYVVTEAILEALLKLGFNATIEGRKPQIAQPLLTREERRAKGTHKKNKQLWKDI